MRARLIALGILLALAGACGGGDAPCTGSTCAVDDVAPCVAAWQCSPWTTTGTSDMGMRTCTDANACGTATGKPPEAAMLPALNAAFYECNVEPILVGGCAMLGCHGTEAGRAYRIYARGRLRISGRTITEPGCLQGGTVHPSEECIGGIECRCWSLPQLAEERRRSFDSARGFALDATGAVVADKTQSELLRQPQSGGGFAHAGIAMWSAGDADYNAVKSWLEGGTLASCNSMN